MSNLPNFDGAAVVYNRAEKIAAHLNASTYSVQRANYTRKTGFKFSPDAEASAICEAMGRGDEHFLKAAIIKYLDIALT